MEDNPLAQAAARGDRSAFTALFERYRGYVYRLAYKVTLCPEEALDATQATFLKVAEKIDRFDGRGNFRAWLATVAVRTAIDLARKRRERASDPTELTAIEDKSLPKDSGNPRTEAESRERLELVEEAMQEISVQQRAILTLQLAEDLGPKEIADRLEIPPGQVRSQLRRAILKLQERLKDS